MHICFETNPENIYKAAKGRNWVLCCTLLNTDFFRLNLTLETQRAAAGVGISSPVSARRRSSPSRVASTSTSAASTSTSTGPSYSWRRASPAGGGSPDGRATATGGGGVDMVRDILRARNPALLNGLDELIQDEAALSAALLGGESDDEGGGGSGGGESGRPVPHSPRSWEVVNSMPTREDAIRSRGADVLVLDASPGGDNTVGIGYETRALSRGHNSPARASVGDEAVSVASDGSDAEVASDSNACVICLDAPKSSIFLPVRPPLPPLVELVSRASPILSDWLHGAGH